MAAARGSARSTVEKQGAPWRRCLRQGWCSVRHEASRMASSPFYVMDEVAVALDDHNLGRLLEALEGLRESSQLIVVTHQKRTKIADVHDASRSAATGCRRWCRSGCGSASRPDRGADAKRETGRLVELTAAVLSALERAFTGEPSPYLQDAPTCRTPSTTTGRSTATSAPASTSAASSCRAGPRPRAVSQNVGRLAEELALAELDAVHHASALVLAPVDPVVADGTAGCVRVSRPPACGSLPPSRHTSRHTGRGDSGITQPGGSS